MNRMNNPSKYLYHKILRGKCASLLFIFILLFNVSVYYVWFSLAQDKNRKEIKAQIKAGFKDAELTLIRVTGDNESEIKWIRANDEFLYKGEMFDVVRIITRNGIKSIYCINDIKEKKLIGDFARNHDSNQKTRKLLSYISFNFVSDRSMHDYIPEISGCSFSPWSSDFKSTSPDIVIPPPKLFFIS